MIQKPLQLTLAMFKPDILKKPYAFEEIRNIILKNHFYIIQSDVYTPQKLQMEKFYSTHKEKPFYKRLLEYMLSGSYSSHILARVDAIAKWRELMGPTKHDNALLEAPGSIRGRFGITDTRNAVHGSDSLESAKYEIAIMHPQFDYEAWFTYEEPKFRTGDGIIYDFDKGIHIIQNSESLLKNNMSLSQNKHGLEKNV